MLKIKMFTARMLLWATDVPRLKHMRKEEWKGKLRGKVEGKIDEKIVGRVGGKERRELEG